MKNVFITGVSSGIGWGMAKALLEKGYKVYALSRRFPEDLLKHESFYFKSVDLKETESIQRHVSDLLKDVESLEYVVLNAGILGKIGDMQTSSVSAMKEVMDINMWANKVVLDAVFQLGVSVQQVVAVSSGASVSGSRGWNGYSLSKAALNMLVKLYAAEETETHFTAFAPGLVDTAMQDYICGDSVDNEKFPTAARLKAARYTDVMPQPERAGQILTEAFDKLRAYPSGDYVDVRKM